MGCITTTINANPNKNNKPALNCEYKWQWYAGTFGWKDYDLTLSNKINNAYVSNISLYTFKLQSSNTKYEIDFGTMKQRNLYTNKLRTIQRIPRTNEQFVWKYYNEEQDKWYQYNDNISLQIETAHHLNYKVTLVKVNGFNFEICLNELPMHQCNLKTGEISQIRRMIINHNENNHYKQPELQIEKAIQYSDQAYADKDDKKEMQYVEPNVSQKSQNLAIVEQKLQVNIDGFDGPTKQFYNFLKENKLEIYFDKFKMEQCCDIRDIEYIMNGEQFLENTIGMKSPIHRKKFIGEMVKFKDKMDSFEDCALIPNMTLQKLKGHGIVTMEILCNEIEIKSDIKNKLDIDDDNCCDLLWNIIRSQSVPRMDEMLEVELGVNNNLQQRVLNKDAGHVNVEDTAGL